MFTTTIVLAAIGGLNWGLIALFDFNLVTALFGTGTILTDLMYLIVAFSSVYVLIAQLTRLGSSTPQTDATTRRNRYDEREVRI